MNEEGAVSTEDTPPERPQNVITSDSAPIPPASPGDDKSKGDQNSDKSGSSDNKTKGDDDQKPSRSAKRKIRRLKQQVSDLESQVTDVPTLQAKLDAAEAELEELKQSSHGSKKPAREDYKNDDEFAEAYHDWKQSGKPPTKKSPKPKIPAKAAKANPFQDEIDEIIDYGSDNFDEWDEAMDNKKGAPINQQMAEFLFEMDEPETAAKTIMYLHENRKEAKELFVELLEAGSRKTVKAMDALIEKVKAKNKDSGKDTDKDKNKGKGTNAGKKKDPPEPANHDVGGNQDTASEEITGQESMDDYATKRNAQIRKKRRP